MTKDEIIELFSNDRFATRQAGVSIVEAGERYARCEMEITGCHLNAMGKVMGGALFTLADLAFAVAANHDKLEWVSTTSTINYLSSACSGTLTAEAHCLKQGRRSCVYSINIRKADSTTVAVVTTTGTKLSVSA